jgi:hypothetical protein
LPILGVGFDVGLQFEKNDWQFGLMVRDITTTYNVWNIDEGISKKLQMPYQDKIKNFLKARNHGSKSTIRTF